MDNSRTALFEALGFRWDRDAIPRQLPSAAKDRVLFRFSKMLPEYVWDAGVLEGNPFTFPEVQTLLEGITVGGRKLSDQEQILNLAESSKYLLQLVKQGKFRLDKETFCALNERVARHEAFEWGHFRGEGTETSFTPDDRFFNGIRKLEQDVSNTFEKAAAFFLFGSVQQFFFDGNKRTSRFMMNGVLMMQGIDAISIPAVRARHFNSRMVDFYLTRDATEMMAFVLDCHPEIAQIRQLNPGLSVIKDLPQIQYHRFDPRDRLSIEERQRQAAERWKNNQNEPNMPGPATTHASENRRITTEATREHDTNVDLDPEV
jgi:hypothetical protein